MSIRKIPFFLSTFILLGTSLFAEDPEPKNSLSFDLYGISYNQYLVTYERQIYGHLSFDIALGYSPQGLFNFYGTETNYSSYYLAQFDVKSYVFNDSMKDLYVGFGMQLDVAPNLLNYKYGESAFDSSGIVGTYGLFGWKFLIDEKSGFYIDPMFWIYTSTPLGLTVNEDLPAKTWGYKLWAPMLTLNIGYLF